MYVLYTYSENDEKVDDSKHTDAGNIHNTHVIMGSTSINKKTCVF